MPKWMTRAVDRRWLFGLLLLCAIAPGAPVGDRRAAAGGEPALRVLVFSRTEGFRHDSIPDAIAAIESLGMSRGWDVTATEDPAAFERSNLVGYDVVVFALTTGDVLSGTQQSAFEDYIEGGGGYVGIHSAADTEYGWSWYGDLVGAYFDGHPAPQNAQVRVVDPAHPSSAELPRRWGRFDEWYNYRDNPRGKVHVLATLDEGSYAGGGMGYDHPIAWCHRYDGGRSWYTGGGHTQGSYQEPAFRDHLVGGIEWAGGRAAGDCGATIETNFEQVVLDSNLEQPMELAVAPDGSIYFIQRTGKLRVWDPATSRTRDAGTLPVTANHEDGLLGLALDPGFATNKLLYLFYSPADGAPRQHLSQFRMAGDFLDVDSERVLLTVPTQRDECCHSGGSLAFDGAGNLFIATGDNTNPFGADGFAPIDQRSGRSAWDAAKSSGNTDDLRGKILRIRPDGSGGYTIPSGNLFPSGGGRPEIYAMGVRNPFRIGVDPDTGTLYWGDVGPDSDSQGAPGPRGHDEVNRAPTAGNFGWPYCIADNLAYNHRDFESGSIGGPYDCNAPVNDSPNNTGAAQLPPARPAWIYYPYGTTDRFPELGSGGRTIMAGPVFTVEPVAGADGRFPDYYDHTLFIYEWSRNWIKEVKVDDAGELLAIAPFMPGTEFRRPIDIAFGPDGSMYLLEWGLTDGGSAGQLSQIAYPGGRFTPRPSASAMPRSGRTPLSVRFSSDGSTDPNGDPLDYAWDFDADGRVDSTDRNPRHVYDDKGDFTAQLTLTDPDGNRAVANVPIVAGNTEPRIVVEHPPPGSIYRRDEYIAYRVRVEDDEDGTTADCIACNGVIVQPALGHDDHSHSLVEQTGCQGVFRAVLEDDPELENLYYVLEARYTDRGAEGVSAITGSTKLGLQPSRKEAEFFTSQEGLLTEPTTDAAGGGLNIGFIAHGDRAMYAGINLLDIDMISFRVASAGSGGRIEVHLDAPDGPLLATAPVPVTGNWQEYIDVVVPVVDPGGMHDLHMVFLNNPGDDGLFNVNWIEFLGPGVSSPEPPAIEPDRDDQKVCPDPEDEMPGEGGGCGCHSSGPGGGATTLLAVAAALWLARRRSITARRRSAAR